MSQEYNLILDYHKLSQFLDWLPDLEPDEKFLIYIFARKKYTDHNIKSTCQIDRFAATKKDFLLQLSRREVRKGLYVSNGEPVPEEAIAVYCTVNPRSMVKANIHLLKKCLDLQTNNASGYNIIEHAITSLSSSVSRKIWIDFDIDDPDFDNDKLRSILNDDSYKILKTKGGVHVLVDPKKVSSEFQPSFYKNMMQYADRENSSDMVPVPGCTQGGFIPYFIN